MASGQLLRQGKMTNVEDQDRILMLKVLKHLANMGIETAALRAKASAKSRFLTKPELRSIKPKN